MAARGMQRGGGGSMAYATGVYPVQGGNENKLRNIDFSRLKPDLSGYFNICFQKPEGNINMQAYATGVYPVQGGNKNKLRNIDFSRLKPDLSGYFNICFQKPEGNINMQEARTVFEEYGKVPVVHCTAKTIFIRFEERDAAEAALLGLIETDQFENLTIPARHSSSVGGGGTEEKDVIVRNFPQKVTEEEVREIMNQYNPVKVAIQVKEDEMEAFVRFPNEEKAKEFVGKLEDRGVVGKLLPPRKKKKVEPMAGENMDERQYYDSVGNLMEPLESEARMVELWVGNFPKDTKQEEIEDWFKKYGGTTHISMKEKKDKEWGYAFVGVKRANQAQRAMRELNKKKVGSFSIRVQLSQSEQMATPVEEDYDYGGYGDCGGTAYVDDAALEMLEYEENIKELRRTNKIQRASHLAYSADFMLKEVLDDCPLCGLVGNAMQELCSVLNSLLPGEGPLQAQEDLEVTVVGSQRKVNITGSPIGEGMFPAEPTSEQKSSVQDELNELNPHHAKKHGMSSHVGHAGHGSGHQPKHTKF